jgi:hypothetical protein
MRAQTIHVTDHALLRWQQRTTRDAREIVDIVKKSKIIKKNELLPFCLPRIPYTVYAIYSGILFILESVTIDEYRLITVIAEKR